MVLQMWNAGSSVEQVIGNPKSSHGYYEKRCGGNFPRRGRSKKTVFLIVKKGFGDINEPFFCTLIIGENFLSDDFIGYCIEKIDER